MKYIIVSFQTGKVKKEGALLLLKANPVIDTKIIDGCQLPNYLCEEAQDTENFAFKISIPLIDAFMSVLDASKAGRYFWEPNMEEYEKTRIMDFEDKEIWAYKHSSLRYNQIPNVNEIVANRPQRDSSIIQPSKQQILNEENKSLNSSNMYSVPVRPYLSEEEKVDNYVEAYKYRAAGVIRDMKSMYCPANLSDNYNKIISDTEEMLGCGIGNFVNLADYFEKQSREISSLIQNNIKNGQMEYANRMIANVIKATLFYIDEGFAFFDFRDSVYWDLVVMKFIKPEKTKLQVEQILRVMKCIDHFYTYYNYKDMLYEQQKDNLICKCASRGVDVRPTSQKVKETASGCGEELFQFLIMAIFGALVIYILGTIFSK